MFFKHCQVFFALITLKDSKNTFFQVFLLKNHDLEILVTMLWIFYLFFVLFFFLVFILIFRMVLFSIFDQFKCKAKIISFKMLFVFKPFQAFFALITLLKWKTAKTLLGVFFKFFFIEKSWSGNTCHNALNLLFFLFCFTF